MNYKQYISSPLWKQVRQSRLDFDGGLCVVCHQPAYSVHHLRYPQQWGEEDIANDLVSTCRNHHDDLDDFERWHRYERRQHLVENHVSEAQERKGVTYGLANDSVPVDFRLPDVDAQRPNRRPAQPLVEVDEASFRQTKEDGCRLRRTCSP
jgi:hypothetical protein